MHSSGLSWNRTNFQRLLLFQVLSPFTRSKTEMLWNEKGKDLHVKQSHHNSHSSVNVMSRYWFSGLSYCLEDKVLLFLLLYPQDSYLKSERIVAAVCQLSELFFCMRNWYLRALICCSWITQFETIRQHNKFELHDKSLPVSQTILLISGIFHNYQWEHLHWIFIFLLEIFSTFRITFCRFALTSRRVFILAANLVRYRQSSSSITMRNLQMKHCFSCKTDSRNLRKFWTLIIFIIYIHVPIYYNSFVL